MSKEATMDKPFNPRATAPECMTELMERLGEMYAARERGEVDSGFSKDQNNTAGKMIKGYSSLWEYQAKRGEKPHVPFMK